MKENELTDFITQSCHIISYNIHVLAPEPERKDRGVSMVGPPQVSSALFHPATSSLLERQPLEHLASMADWEILN